MRRKVKNAAVRVAAVGFLLGFVSLATAGSIVENFDNYNDGLLVGQGPWVTADGVDNEYSDFNTYMKQKKDYENYREVVNSAADFNKIVLIMEKAE